MVPPASSADACPDAAFTGFVTRCTVSGSPPPRWALEGVEGWLAATATTDGDGWRGRALTCMLVCRALSAACTPALAMHSLSRRGGPGSGAEPVDPRSVAAPLRVRVGVPVALGVASITAASPSRTPPLPTPPPTGLQSGFPSRRTLLL